jgi:hypothetical protein
MKNIKGTYSSLLAREKLLPFIALVIGTSSLLFLIADGSVMNLRTPFVTSVEAADHSLATVVDRTRSTDPNTGYAAIDDFERIIYVKSTQSVTTIGRNNNVQKRAFVGATLDYEPAMPVQDVIRHAGGDVNPADDLVAMRCRPPDRSKTQAVLATWPNLFKALVADLGETYSSADCPAAAGDTVDKKAYCAALDFVDQPNTQVPLVLQAMMTAGVALLKLQGGAFQPTGSTVGADLLYDLYGVGYGYSGLGYSVKNSYLSGNNVSLNSTQTLAQSVVPEYLLMNVTLADGGCSCIRVSPYTGRDQQFIHWNRVLEEGSTDSCTVLTHLP